MPSGVPPGRAPTLTAPPTSDQLLTWTDTPRSHGGDKAKVSGRRSAWLSPTLSYSDDPAPRGTLSPVGSIFNLLTVPRAEPQGSSQAQRQPHWLAPTPSFASCTPIGCCWKDFKIASGFRLARRPRFCSAVLTMSSTNTFSFITYGKELYPPFPSLLLCKNCDTRVHVRHTAHQIKEGAKIPGKYMHHWPRQRLNGPSGSFRMGQSPEDCGLPSFYPTFQRAP